MGINGLKINNDKLQILVLNQKLLHKYNISDFRITTSFKGHVFFHKICTSKCENSVKNFLGKQEILKLCLILTLNNLFYFNSATRTLCFLLYQIMCVFQKAHISLFLKKILVFHFLSFFERISSIWALLLLLLILRAGSTRN